MGVLVIHNLAQTVVQTVLVSMYVLVRDIKLIAIVIISVVVILYSPALVIINVHATLYSLVPVITSVAAIL